MTKDLSEKTEAIRAESELEIGRNPGRISGRSKQKTRSPSCDRRGAGRAPAAGGELQVGEEVEIGTSTSVIGLALVTRLTLESRKLVARGSGTATPSRDKLVRGSSRAAPERSVVSLSTVRARRLRPGAEAADRDASQPLNRERESGEKTPPDALSLRGFDKDGFQRSRAGCEAKDRPQRSARTDAGAVDMLKQTPTTAPGQQRTELHEL